METNLTISELNIALQSIQNQINKIKEIIEYITKDEKNEYLLALTKKAEEDVKKLNIEEMNSHGNDVKEIVDWYWNNNHYSSLLVITPNGTHPIDYKEWTEGRLKNNKEATPEFYKDFMIRVIDKGGYIQSIPF